MSDALEVVTTADPVHHPTRVHELRSAVGSLRVRASRGGVEQYLFIAACVLVPLGLGLVLLGWYGSAHTPYQFEQLPYVISGGLLGTALAVLGGLAYFAHWMTRVVNDQRAQTERIVSALENLASSSSSSNGAGAGAGAPAAAVAAVAATATAARGARASRANANGGGSFVATPTGTMFHRPDCVVVANRPKLRKVSADAKGFEACKLCDPLGDG